MDNSLFVFTDNDKNPPIQLDRFHICTWEFDNDSSLVELGFEVSEKSITQNSNQLSMAVYIPWLTKVCEATDLYDKLSTAENSRFIFNDSINATNFLKGNTGKLGVVHKFVNRDELCVLPVKIDVSNEIINIEVNVKPYLGYSSNKRPNIYFRFWIKPKIPYISMRKNGISKSTIIYDIKVNERRNVPDDKVDFFSEKQFCTIINCFSFNILPNKYDIVFFENSSLKNVRTLEYDSFNKYLGDKRVKKDELIVVFNKKQNSESYSFFSIYSKERIGPGQFALAVLINIICGVLLFIPSYRKSLSPEISLFEAFKQLPNEVFLALVIAFVAFFYFTLPLFISFKNKICESVSAKVGWKK